MRSGEILGLRAPHPRYVQVKWVHFFENSVILGACRFACDSRQFGQNENEKKTSLPSLSQKKKRIRTMDNFPWVLCFAPLPPPPSYEGSFLVTTSSWWTTFLGEQKQDQKFTGYLMFKIFLQLVFIFHLKKSLNLSNFHSFLQKKTLKKEKFEEDCLCVSFRSAFYFNLYFFEVLKSWWPVFQHLNLVLLFKNKIRLFEIIQYF